MYKYVGLLCLWYGFILQATGAPGINLWQLTDNLCSVVEVNDSEIEASLTSVYDVVTNIDAQIEMLSGSSISAVVSSLELLISDLEMADSLTELIASSFDIFATQMESLIDAVSTLENIDALVVSGTCSCLDAAVGSAATVLSSDLDVLQTDIDNCCSSLSLFDVLIKSDVDSVSTKVDSVASQVSVVESELDSCCSVVDVIYDCLVGTAITQAMVPYIISASGDYHICGPITTSGAPAITIAVSNVNLNLNGQTITNTNNRGIQSIGNSNITVYNGTIIPSLEALYLTTGSAIHCADLMIINAASTSIYIDTVVEVTISDCNITGTNGQLVANNAAIVLFNSGPAHIARTRVYNQTETGAIGFYIWRASSSYTTELINCSADVATYGFYVYQDTNSTSNVLFKNCIATNNLTYGFYSLGTSSSFNGPIYEGCIASQNAPTNSGIGFINDTLGGTVYRYCVSVLNGTGFLTQRSVDPSYEYCIASKNTTNGIYCANNAGLGNSRPTIDRCVAVTNGSSGYLIDSSQLDTVLNRCIAAQNTGSGINNASSTTDIVDSRSQHAATTVNPIYNLNGAVDVIGGATQIIIS